MITKILALSFQQYAVTKAFNPPNPPTPSSNVKVMSHEGFIGIFFINVFTYLSTILHLILSFCYIYIMYQQEINAIPILPYEDSKFSEWNLVDIICFLCTIGGFCLRLWCFNTLAKFFAFNLEIKKNHKLIKTGPYTLLIHPSYTGAFLTMSNVSLMFYQLHYYIPLYFSNNVRWILSLYLPTLLSFLGIYFSITRVILEEQMMRNNFGKEWDEYVSQRKRFVPYIF
ncbi:969_t:CDS:2 [Funneliformis geosporum]|uniref:Protein-S-isoprenylcysteine O-methyltransferase n=1 Tax=Funneliformis geosporum TaxID=1117311 RepID=A0A9W4SC60_9GLOM|nr:969_t:CDS:2 [Funneliformis geosporum]CAI2163723.1 17106_t:CDS:2 [Funneliformis geosporum]